MAEAPAGSARARLWFAGALALLLVVAVVGVVLASGGEEDSADAAEAPAECLRAWNRDLSAREAGRHSRVFHRYEEAQVGYAQLEGDEVAAIADDPAAGPCAVVFPREGLDPEVEYAGFVVAGGDWDSMSETTPESTLSALQATALDAANAAVTEGGGLAPA